MLKTLLLIASITSCSFFANANDSASDNSAVITPNVGLAELREQNNFKLIGQATFSILFWDLYKAKLLTTTGRYPIEQPNEKLIYEIHYLADISKNDLVERTVEQWQHLGVAKNKYQSYLPHLSTIWPDIRKGDSLLLVIDKGQSLFYFNNKYIGTIADHAFGQLFIDIWLSKNTSEPTLRENLLGGQGNE